MQSPDSLLDGVSAKAIRPGWRLKRLEIRNWGTFNNQVHLVVPDAGWTLLVGENGSGKSTAADALRTLLVPPRLVKDSYNDASGAKKGRDRSRRSYILGAWGSEGQEDFRERNFGISDVEIIIEAQNRSEGALFQLGDQILNIKLG